MEILKKIKELFKSEEFEVTDVTPEYVEVKSVEGRIFRFYSDIVVDAEVKEITEEEEVVFTEGEIIFDEVVDDKEFKFTITVVDGKVTDVKSEEVEETPAEDTEEVEEEMKSETEISNEFKTEINEAFELMLNKITELENQIEKMTIKSLNQTDFSIGEKENSVKKYFKK